MPDSPTMHFRVDAELKSAIQASAASEARDRSNWLRLAAEERLARLGYTRDDNREQRRHEYASA
jgi:hypothetical protein